MVAGIRSHIEELQSQLREYEGLKAGVQKLRMTSFSDLPNRRRRCPPRGRTVLDGPL
jgi:hypothetical protein